MIALSDVQASLSLFAEALAGSPVSFVVVDDRATCWPWRTEVVDTPPAGPAGAAENDAAVVKDAAVVMLPAAAERRDAYRSLVLHQVLFKQLRAEDLGPGTGVLYRQLYSLVEDHRVNAVVRRQFPGDTMSLGRVLADAADQEWMHQPHPVLHVLRSHVFGARRPVLDELISETTVVDFILKCVQSVAGDLATAADSRAAADRLYQLVAALDSGRGVGDLVEITDSEEEGAGAPSELTTGAAVDGGTPTEFVDTEGLGGGQLLSELDDEVVATAEPGDREGTAPGLTMPTTAGPNGSGDARTFVYDEWDFHVQQHRRAWCRVIEEQLVGDDYSFIQDVRSRHQLLRSHIRRSLSKMRPQELVRVHRSDDGDELDLDAAIEATIDRRAGAPVDDRVRIRRDRAARDVATAFLVDLSASTSSPAVAVLPEPPPANPDPFDDPMSYGPIWGQPPDAEPVRRVIDVAKDAVALMGDALHELGDRYAIYGFSGTGRDGVEFKIGKDFGDRVTGQSWAAVAAMKPLRYTRMGPAVRHAAAKLAAESARTRLLVVISDGYPQDTDYGNDRTDREYGLHDTARALADANAAGIETYCVTIDPAGHDYLRVMCPDDRYSIIDDVEALPEELANVYLLTVRNR